MQYLQFSECRTEQHYQVYALPYIEQRNEEICDLIWLKYLARLVITQRVVGFS
jgi:hypothetical protein